ncbi:hypothetical protein V5O48_010005 [Marasmius crinis-equi]|uniref:Uncharacterized protein n=1 Tax=Marasmius crinis-equi TaxID=585013 RepID=A0ABR3F9X6_9AGAR
MSLSLSHEHNFGISSGDANAARGIISSYHDAVVTFLQRSGYTEALRYLEIAEALVTESSLKRLHVDIHSDDEEIDFIKVRRLDESFFLDGAPEDSHLRRIREHLKGECRMYKKVYAKRDGDF